MNTELEFNLDLIKKYDKAGPRYTSYPTAVVFNEEFTAENYIEQARRSNETNKGQPISLYFHIPFCDTLCFFCACNKIATKKRDKADLYLDYLEKEMAMVSALYDKDRVVEQMHFGGGTPTFLTDSQFERMWELIKTYFPIINTEKRDYSIEIDPRSVTRESMQKLAGYGFNRFSLGVQDVNPKVQKAVNRIQPTEMTAEIIQACRDVNALSVSVDLIYGLPFQTLESFAQTVDAVIEMSPDRLSVFNYAHLPHLFSPQKRINEEDLPPAEEKLAILQMTIEKLNHAGYVYIGMDHFAKPDDELAIAQQNGSLQRNFQGYTTHAELDLVALGVSSISSVNHSFSQNVKSLEQYYAILDNDKLPVYRGYLLNDDDLLRKKVIQDIACQFELDFKKIEDKFDIEFESYFAKELDDLKDMQKDDLLQFNNNGFTVSPAGRILVRHICMVFDIYLRKQSEQRFSKVI
ncbi:MAG TPA: oxygen-independent coproporphyrinogen III oxidase [Gammaproteobacteria bacterium]|nr:oxygen-independent coproporphyrinogen III oxidase [Xanthomonadales bacterium]MCB1593352.1 oxygen-independent coproporphyrinogen III oxidase [Xanthomonadales bacterium]HPI94609.1 oxygen-independent coproporphyrinogen III oxidase [Gammaproteobacteria bacterium]HPQ86054.1 oxygen-independent coproporphyrinogen III oxidase [Gammaproteobacteria bacterium]